MAQTIKIKRSTSTAVPGSLTAGELAYSQSSNKLFIGRPADGAVTTIGGDLYVNMLDHDLGTLTASSAITTDSSNKVNQFKTANLTIGANSITSGSGDIDLVAAANLDIDAGTIDLSTQATDFKIIDNSATGMTISTAEHTYLTFDSTNTVEKILVGKKLDINGLELILDADGDTSITADTDDRIDFKVGGGDELSLTTSALRPSTDGSIGLGTSSFKYASLFVDNLKLDGNTLTSEDTNGNINITPNGNGKVVLDGFAFPVNGSGTNGQFLRQDGSGNLEFATVVSTLTLSADSGTNDSISTGETLTFNGTNPINTAVSDNAITISVTDASTSAKGVASFATANFTVSNGAVSTKNIVLGGSTLTNGSTTTDLTGLNSLGVDDLTLNGSTISTSAGNNNIVLSPHGTGVVRVPSGYKDRSQFNANSLVTKEYVDAIKQNLDIKDSVHLASTANVSLTAGSSGLEAGDTIDGVSLTAGDRVLLKNQTDASENGIYVAVASGGTPARSTDANANDKVTSGLFIFIEEGSTNGDQGYVLTTNSAIDLGNTALVFTQFSGAGQITAGNGIVKSGNTLSADVDNVTLALASGDLNIKGITQTRKGDLILGATTNDAGYNRLPVGTADQILTVQGGTLAYTSVIDGGTFS
jgi:hypothetical protein